MNKLPTSDQLVRDPIGIFPSATVACFDPTSGELPRRSLDESLTTRFLELLARLQVPAVLIAASTGHGHVRTVPELEAWFGCAARARCGATLKMALLRPEDGDSANERLVAGLAVWGYPVVFIRPGRNLAASATDQEVAANMLPLVTAAASQGLAVGVYSIPDVSGVRLTPKATEMLVNGPGGERIIAVKVTESDYEASTLKFLEHPPLKHLKIVQGWDPHLTRALQDGPRYDTKGRQRCGVTSGPMSFAVYQYLHLLAAADRKDWPEVEAAQSAVTAIFRAMQDDPQKFADLQRAKFVMGLGQPITASVSQEQVERIFSAIEQLPRAADRVRLAKSLDLLGDGPFHERLSRWSDEQ